MGRSRKVFVARKKEAISKFEEMGHTIANKLKSLFARRVVCAYSGDLIREHDMVAFIIGKDNKLAMVKYGKLNSASARRDLLQKEDIKGWLSEATRSSNTAGARKSGTQKRERGRLPVATVTHG